MAAKQPHDHKTPKNQPKTVEVMGVTVTISPAIFNDLDMVEYLYDLQTAQTVEQGVVERIRQRSARPAENGTSPGGAAITRADVASMTRAQREALERRAMHGVKISF